MNALEQELYRIFPFCNIDIRKPFFGCLKLDSPELRIMSKNFVFTIVGDIKQPFERQPKMQSEEMRLFEDYESQRLLGNSFQRSDILYDGFMMQRMLGEMLPSGETGQEHVHIIFTNRLVCTFSEDDWRYHARALICGTPSIVSTTGIVEAPARSLAYYLEYARISNQSMNVEKDLHEEFSKQFIGYEDDRITGAAIGYTLQAIVYFLSAGEPFCDSLNCRLFNAHWQSELILTQIERPAICTRHMEIISAFNKSLDIEASRHN